MSHFHREALRARYKAIGKNNVGAAFGDVHPDFELKTGARIPGAGTYRGSAAATQFLEDLVEPFEEVAYEPQELFERGDQIVIFLLIRFQPRGSSAMVENQVGALWTIRDGRPVRCEMFPRREDALAAAGMTEADLKPG